MIRQMPRRQYFGLTLRQLVFLVVGLWLTIILLATGQLSTFLSPSQKQQVEDEPYPTNDLDGQIAELKRRNAALQHIVDSAVSANRLHLSINGGGVGMPESPVAPQMVLPLVAVDDSLTLLQKPVFDAFSQLPSSNNLQIKRPGTSSLQAGSESSSSSSQQLSVLFEMLSRYRGLRVQVEEMWFYLRNKIKKDLKDNDLYNEFYDRYRLLFANAERFRDVTEPVILSFTQNLSSIVFQRIYRNQFPADCSAVRYALCTLGKGCGFGCQMHHVAYCLTVAFATGRTLILNGKPWSYSKQGFSGVFHDITKPECVPVGLKFDDANNAVEWDAEQLDQSQKLIKIPIVDALHKRPNYMPMGIPRVFARDLKALHSQPFVWWIGHFLRFILRPKAEICEHIDRKAGTWFQNSTRFHKPLVGIQIRRTDKLLAEAQFHKLEEYMVLVKEYYDQLEYKLGRPVERAVYIATDEATVFKEAAAEYPSYTFLGDPSIANAAALATRYSDDSLRGILVDVYFLARSDFLVCTFSSQVCRLAFALMQTIRGDAGDRFRSLDDIYYYGGQQEHFFKAVLPHKAGGQSEIDLEVDDVVHIAGNHWDGWSKGTNKRTGKHGLFPSYKTEDIVPEGDFVPFNNARGSFFSSPWFRLIPDSCLVVGEPQSYPPISENVESTIAVT